MPQTRERALPRADAPEVKGWCPGAFAPMASGDGLLIRAKIIGARVGAPQLRAIAGVAADCGNGLVDLSQRAQLQIRGLSEKTLDEARRRLAESDLLAPDAGAERIVNIVTAPLAGLDQRALLDGQALTRDLARALRADRALSALPSKFLFSIDDASALSIGDVAADIHIAAIRANAVAVCVEGAPHHAVLTDARGAVGAALRLARAFVDLRPRCVTAPRRMRGLVAELGLDALLSAAGLDAQPLEPFTAPHHALAHGVQRLGEIFYVGVAAPFGRWRANDLEAIADLAASCGHGEIRLTPWRVMLIPASSETLARHILSAACARDLIVAKEDPRLAVVACSGAPECPQARGATRAHLARLAPLARALAQSDGVGLHISGCAKGCARPGAAPVTLVARNDRFDVIIHGRACDAPRARGLTIDEIERVLGAYAKEKSPCPTP